jgi:receptor protein-tyrosine kinase
VLVEADLRNPVVAASHKLSHRPGLAELLTHQIELAEAVQEVPLATGTGSREGEGSLAVIVAGASPPNPAELLESQAMSQLLDRLGAEYDFVVVDTAPTGVVSDAFPLLSHVSGVIVVSRLGMASRDSAALLRDQLRQLGAPLLGIVANGVKLRGRDRYGYGRGYYGRREPDREAKAPVTTAP